MAASSANRRSRRYFIWTLDFDISLERLQSFQSDLVWRKIPSVASPKACFSRKAKHIPNKIVARTHPFFTSPRILKGSDVEPSKSTVPFKSLRKDLMVLRSLGGHPILGRILNRPSLLIQVKILREVYECYEEWLRLFPAVLLQLSDGEHHING